MKTTEKIVTGPARRPKPVAAVFKTSALESARRAGLAGAHVGPPDLAANRKRYSRAKANGKTGATR